MSRGERDQQTPDPAGGALYTVGHSHHALPVFHSLLDRHHITLLCDVRSQPWSGRYPQFNRDRLAGSLAEIGIEYLFMGRELGARPADPSMYSGGRVDFARLAAGAAFQDGLRQLMALMQARRCAIMCAERDPVACHRMILVSRALQAPQIEVHHILGNGELEPNAGTEARLLKMLRMPEADLFAAPLRLEDAYDRQAQRIAYVLPPALLRSQREPVR